MTQVEAAKQEIEALINKTQFEKMIGVVGILTRLFEENQLKPIIVGGFAVEIYTQSDYSTVDIDIVFSRWDLARDMLLKLGFKQHGKHFYHEKLFVSIEIPGDMLEDSDDEKVIKVNLPNGDSVFVIGIEDIILDRLRACKHWKSTADCEWGKRLFMIHRDHLDTEYMKECSTRDLTSEILQSWMQ